jgi:hypothetical protein
MTAVSISAITFIGMPGRGVQIRLDFLQIYMVIPWPAGLFARFSAALQPPAGGHSV